MYSETPAILLLPTNKEIEVVETSTIVRIQSITPIDLLLALQFFRDLYLIA